MRPCSKDQFWFIIRVVIIKDMERLKISQDNYEKVVEKAVTVLKEGGLIIYPTETCYGVGVVASNEEAVSKLLEYKKRPQGKAISIAVNSLLMAKKFVEVNKTAEKFYKEFLPGPITVISKSKHLLDKRLESESGTLGVRIPEFKLVLDLIAKTEKPITATSANSAGKKTPYTIEDVLNNLNKTQLTQIALILDAGELPHNPPSTVIDTTKEDLKILRVGDFLWGEKVDEIVVISDAGMLDLGDEIITKYKSVLETSPILILFNADLGAGKTQFVKGIGRSMGVKEIINSPTYTIMKEYPYKFRSFEGKLVHIDAWRLENISEFIDLNIKKYFKPGNIIAVEWAGMARDTLDKISENVEMLKLYIEIDYISFDQRRVVIYEE